MDDLFTPKMQQNQTQKLKLIYFSSVNHSIAGSKYNRGQRYDSPQEQSETRIGNINPDSLGRDSFKDNQESSKHLKEFNGENASNWQQSFASASSGSSSFHSAVFTDEIANNPVYQSTTYQSQNVETTTKYQQTTYKNQPQYNNHNSESGQNETQNNSDSVQHPRPDVDYNQQTTLTGFSEDPEKNTQNQTTDYHETSTEKFIPFFFPNEEHHIVKINDTRLPDYLNLDIKCK